jgi:dihydroorotate dehydrogenase (NAD+) catalytic subunit
LTEIDSANRANIYCMKTQVGYPPIYDINKSFDENLAQGPSESYKTSVEIPKLKQKYKLLGYELNSPFGSSACPTGSDSKYIKRMFDCGYDIVTTKTRRSVYYRPNKMSNIVYIRPGKITNEHDFEEVPDQTTATSAEYDSLTIANSFGNNSIDPEYWVADEKISSSYVKDGQLLIHSIVGTIQEGFNTKDYYNDFAKAASMVKQAGAKAIEINFSCPNVVNEGVLCYDKDAVFAISRLVKDAVGDIPVLAKVGYFPSDSNKLLENVLKSISPFIAGISAINTLAAPIYDVSGKQALPGKGRLKAGISGHAIKAIGLDMTKRLDRIRKDLNLDMAIISMGGVLNAEDFQDYQQAGADAVLSATGAMWNPNLAAEVKSSLV